MDLKIRVSKGSSDLVGVQRVDGCIADYDRASRGLTKRLARVLTNVVEQTARDVDLIAARSKIYVYGSHRCLEVAVTSMPR